MTWYPRGSAEVRFWAKVDKTSGCWLWTASVKPFGYGQFVAGGKVVLAHRWAYENLIGPIAAGFVIDHLCRTPRCVNPAHMEVTSNRENTMRGVAPNVVASRNGTCRRGHPATPENVYHRRDGRKANCRSCMRYRKELRYVARDLRRAGE